MVSVQKVLTLLKYHLLCPKIDYGILVASGKYSKIVILKYFQL